MTKNIFSLIVSVPASLLVASALMLQPSALLAGEPASDSAEYEWTVAPYLWMPDIDAEIGLGPLSVDLDLKARNLASDLDAAYMGFLRYGDSKQFVYLEGMNLHFRDKEFEPFFNQAVDAEVFLVEVVYGRHYSLDKPALENILVSPYIGLRYSALDVKISSGATAMKADESWVDLTLGAIVEGPLRCGLSWTVKVDGAGFNIDKSRYVSVFGGFQYSLTDTFTAVAGYRWVDFDARPGGGNDLKLELDGKGPKFGVRATF